MFGLTKREQRWKAEQQAAEVLASVANAALRAAAEIRVAEAQTDAAELARLRAAEANFHMEYRMRCDAETKAQAVEIERLRAALQEADNIMGHEDEHTAWRERWQTLWPWSGGPNVF
jgi:hypothetical protein